MCVRLDSASPAHTSGVGRLFYGDLYCGSPWLTLLRRGIAASRYFFMLMPNHAGGFRLFTGLARVAGFVLIELSVQVLHDSIT